MGIIKRTFTSLTKRLSKTFILLLIIFLLGNVIAGAVAVKNATGQLENSMKSQLGAKAKIDYDMSKAMSMMNGDGDVDNVTSSKADEIGKLPEVKNISYDLTHHMGSENIKKYVGSSGMHQNGGESFHDFNISGSNSKKSSSFESSSNQVIEGEYPNKSTEALISKELADKNNIKVGDTVKFYAAVIEDMGNVTVLTADPEVEEKKDYEFTVSGFFKSKDMESSDQMKVMMAEMECNTIYTTIDVPKEIDDFQSAYYSKRDNKSEGECRMPVTPTYELNSPEDIDSFKEKASKLIDTDVYKIETSKDSFDSVASSLTSMNKLSKGILIFGVVATVLILTLVLILFLRERKKEFGIYQALGENRAKTILQLLLEVLIIAVIAVSLSVFSGNFIAKNISEEMIKNQMTNTGEKSSVDGGIIIAGNSEPLGTIDKDEITKNYNVEITKEYLIFFYGIMIGTVIISTILPSYYILRMKTRKILL